MKTEFTAQDAAELVKQFEGIKSLPAIENGSRFISNSWLIENEETPRTIFFTFQTVDADPAAHFGEPIVIAVNKELIAGLRENFQQLIALAPKELADKLWDTVYSDTLEHFWCNASGGGMTICNGVVALTVTTEHHNPNAVPGDDIPANASEEALIDTMRRCRAFCDADGSELSFSVTIPDKSGEDVCVGFDFLSRKNPETAAALPKTKRQPFNKSPAFTRLARELGFLTPYTFTEITSPYMYQTGKGTGDVDAFEGDNFVLLRHGDAVLKVRFNVAPPQPSAMN